MQRIDIRIDKEVKAMLQTICKKDSRSMTKEIEQLIKKRFEILKNNK